MLADIAYISMIIAFFLSPLSMAIGSPLFNAANKIHICIRLMQLQFIFLTITFALLIVLFIKNDFSTATVYQNSHSLQPLIYKITAVWGNHEGSLLLWVWVLSLFASLYPSIAATDENITIKVLLVQAAIIGGFLTLLIWTSNPLAEIIPAPQEGQSLNPLLQDPGLVIHPPLLYIGYVGLSVNFSLAVAALWHGTLTKQTITTMRRFALLAWGFLTAGIGLGSWWAYYELGWGGFWFWDPVENASFIPWLVTVALIHSLVVTEKRNALQQWSLLLSLTAFSLSLLGTFLVRSGILTSVHAFASDPVRGLFILSLLTVVLAGAFLLFARRGHLFSNTVKSGGGFHPMSREGGLLLNNFLLTASAGVVLIGTLFPLFVELFGGGKMTVGAPYFNISWTPLILMALLLMAFMPLMAWQKGDIKKSLRILLPAYGVALISLFVFWFLYEKILAVLVLTFAVFLMASVVVGFLRQRRLQVGKKISGGWGGLGMSLAHFGVALLLFGAGGVSLLSYDKAYNVMVGDKVQFIHYNVELRNVHAGAENNYLFLRGDLFFNEIKGRGGFPFRLHPERRLYLGSGQTTTEAAIRSSLLGDYYATIAERGIEIENNGEGGEGEHEGGEGRSYILHLHYKPFAIILWIAVAVIVLGGGVSLFSHFRKGGV